VREIWKFPLELSDEVEVSMPIDAKVLSVSNQRPRIMLWALVDPSAEKEIRKFRIYGTGHQFKSAENLKFVGTVQDPHGTFELVWHVFEVIEKVLPN
jgi:hypothetical protein